jgi:hypothetical protein
MPSFAATAAVPAKGAYISRWIGCNGSALNDPQADDAAVSKEVLSVTSVAQA